MKKAFLVGAIIGGAAAAITSAFFLLRTKNAPTLHLFVLENQEDKEEQIEDMIPKESEAKENEEPKQENSAEEVTGEQPNNDI